MIRIEGENLLEYFRQTKEFIFIDSVDVDSENKCAQGVKELSSDEWFFPLHFPDDPVMPGVFQMEAVMQTGGLILNTMEGKKEQKLYFYSCEDAKIYKSARPGCILKTSAELKSYRRGIAKFIGSAKIDDEVSCEIRFTIIVPEEIIS